MASFNKSNAVVTNYTGSDSSYPVNLTLTSTVPWQVDDDNYTTNGGDANGDDVICGFQAQYGILPSIVAVVLFSFGLLLTFFGYRFFKAILFMSGFLFGSVLTYMVMVEQDILPPEGNLGIAVGAGILLGFITMLVSPIGLFTTGLNLGVALATAGLVVVDQFTHLTIKWIPIGVVLGVGIIFGIVALRFQKGMTVAGTSVIGAAMAMTGLDHFIELSRMSSYIWDRIMAYRSPGLCWFSWAVFGCWPLLAVVGVLVQWKFTGVGVDHNLALRSRREQGATLQQERARQKRESQQTRYRHLYQARRVKGDMISQNYLHSVQDKLSPAMRSLTALNTEPANEEESTATTTLTQLT